MADEVTPAEQAELLLTASESMAMILETIADYRKKCEEAGFSPTAAEQMAVDMHRMMVVMAAGGKA